MAKSQLRITLPVVVIGLALTTIIAGCGTQAQFQNPYNLVVGFDSFDHTELLQEVAQFLTVLEQRIPLTPEMAGQLTAVTGTGGVGTQP